MPNKYILKSILRGVSTMSHSAHQLKPAWQTLPPELISQIITELLSGFPLPVFEPDALYLGQICSTWRDTFISSPKFWSSLAIDFDPTRHLPSRCLQDFDHALYVVELCLERSQNHLLTFGCIGCKQTPIMTTSANRCLLVASGRSRHS